MTRLKLNWDKYSLIINSKRIFILAGEFHYWRIPDRDRWIDILRMYKIAGLNAVRIYFHWGYHSPSENKYIFTDNRDIDFLLRICEDLGLYVLVAAGPYICAETSAGGFPGWLLSKREVRIKHLKQTGETVYDAKYMEYCRDWYKKFIELARTHQITENPNGCIIGFQIENEYSENQLSSRIYIEELIKYAREFGITVPTFHNDVWELGSWNGLVDLNGFDKYPIWAERFLIEGKIPQWKVKKFSIKLDHLEKKVRSFGKAAAESPILIPELQGGWFNHWGIPYGYDTLYNFYGATYQKMLSQSIAAQGCTMMSFYMFYGGTTWGSLNDPEVYTSYDYSACIREYGYQSERLRQLRLFSLFIKSFNDSISKTDLIEEPKIKSNEKQFFIGQRDCFNDVEFYFFRNFNRLEKQNYSIQFNQKIRIPKEGIQKLNPRDSFIAFGNYEIDGFHIIFCSLVTILKGNYADGTLLVFLNNGGELILEGIDFEISSDITVYQEITFTRITFKNECFGYIKNAEGKKIYLICLSKQSALSLNADLSQKDVKLAWGAYSLFFTSKNTLEIETINEQDIYLLIKQDEIENFKNLIEKTIPGLKKGTFGKKISIPEISLGNWHKIKTDWSNYNNSEIWKEIDFNTERDPIDHHYTNGHVLYKCEFTLKQKEPIELEINTRHKNAIWLNNEFIGGHVTYNYDIGQPGAMNGPDPSSIGAIKYELTRSIRSDKNILYIITENLGHSKIFLFSDDGRNPRGILSARFSNKPAIEKWYISGIDVTTLDQSYNTSGLPGEKFNFHLGESDKWSLIKEKPSICPKDQIIWYKTTFNWKIDDIQRIPLRIHLEGKHNINIFLNGMYIGRYWGDYGPQHDFYIMDKILKEKNILVLACWTTNEDNFKISIKPYKININSGNLDESGQEFVTMKHLIKF